MKRRHRCVHVWLWLATAAASTAVLAAGVLTRTDPTPDQPAAEIAP